MMLENIVFTEREIIDFLAALLRLPSILCFHLIEIPQSLSTRRAYTINNEPEQDERGLTSG